MGIWPLSIKGDLTTAFTNLIATSRHRGPTPPTSGDSPHCPESDQDNPVVTAASGLWCHTPKIGRQRNNNIGVRLQGTRD
ncbi:hypothetical protein Tco_1494985 [Tanacetum coccineum]